MEDIKDVTLEAISESKYIKPHRVHYTQNGKRKIWDISRAHDSVVILIHNVTRNVFVFVKQFRPAVYLKKAGHDFTTNTIDTSKAPGSLGVSYELCAGLVDKQKPLVEIAVDEVLEETGYKVSTQDLEKITSHINISAAVSGQTMYYCRVTDEMRVTSGGGCEDEGELIDVVEVPVDEALGFVMNEEIHTPIGMMFALLWFEKYKKSKI